MNKTIRPKCKKCGVPMKVGKALINSFGRVDIHGKFIPVSQVRDDETVYPVHSQVIFGEVWKCPKCGRSVR